MSCLYVSDQGGKISYSGNRIIVNEKSGEIRSIPAYPLETIQIFGNVQITTQCMAECLKNGITVLFYSTAGAYFGRLVSTNHVNVHRQRIQANIDSNEPLKLSFSKNIISAKINNQVVLLRRYARNKNVDISKHEQDMLYIKKKIEKAENIEQLMGFEGYAARIYFSTLGKLIDTRFYFEKRTKRPPLDPFNSMISLGYSVLLNEVYGLIEAKGMNAYFGLMHKDREKHPALASDLMEEWRAPIVDATVMSMINGHEIFPEEFRCVDQKAVYMEPSAFKKFILKLDKKFKTDVRYLKYVDYPVSVRRAIDLQLDRYIQMMETEDPSKYIPLTIR